MTINKRHSVRSDVGHAVLWSTVALIAIIEILAVLAGFTQLARRHSQGVILILFGIGTPALVYLSALVWNVRVARRKEMFRKPDLPRIYVRD